MSRNQVKTVFLRLFLVVVIVSSALHVYFIARADRYQIALGSTHQELVREAGPVEDKIQVDEDQRIPVTKKGRRRVLALSYHEQLNSALKYEIFPLATLAADLNASIVEPVVVNSRMYGCPNLIPEWDQPHADSAMPLSSMVDMRTPLRECAGVEMESLKAFVQDLPSKVVLVYAHSHKNGILREFNVPQRFDDELVAAMQAKGSPAVLQCTNLFQKESHDMLTMVEKGLSYNKSHPYQIDQVVCFNASKFVKSHELALELPDDEDLLIVLLNWRGCYLFDCSEENYHRYVRTGKFNGPDYAVYPNSRRFKIITNHSLTNFQHCTESAIPHSTLVSTLASKYLMDVVKIRTQFIAVHIRTEIIANRAKMPRSEPATFRAQVSCILQFLNATVSSLLQHNPSLGVVVITDYTGEYGTDSLGGLTRSTAKHIFKFVKSLGWNITYFQPAFMGLAKNMNSGLVSLIEMNMLALGDYLVLAGHGNFQQQLISHHLQQRRKASTVYRIIDTATSCRIKRL